MDFARVAAETAGPTSSLGTMRRDDLLRALAQLIGKFRMADLNHERKPFGVGNQRIAINCVPRGPILAKEG